MADLYAPVISNEVLLSQRNLRHRRINLDYEYISGFPHEDNNLLKGLVWTSIEFKKNQVSAIPDNQGIYMFTLNPYGFSCSNHEAHVVLYIGQAGKLKTRLEKYFYYPNSRKASDQERRFMILFFQDFLTVKYCETTLSGSELDSLEYSLIDSILPPFNLQVHSEVAQAYRRII